MMSDGPAESSRSLADLPVDELVAYGSELGLNIDARTGRIELLRVIRERQALLLELPREALLDVVVWARIPVRRSASKELLAKRIATVTRTRYEGLSDPGLRALARLRGLSATADEPRGDIERRLRAAEGLFGKLRRRRRSLVGSLISGLLESAPVNGAYQFLPEDDDARSWKQTIEDAGVVGGIAQKIRGAADRYIYEKLDEIERRIDHKLDTIDRRLEEWRDREVVNRLRIVKITLAATLVVAILSLGYDYTKRRLERDDGQPNAESPSGNAPPTATGPAAPRGD